MQVYCEIWPCTRSLAEVQAFAPTGIILSAIAIPMCVVGFGFTRTVLRGLREAAVIAVGVLALALAVALVSYDPRDPGFSFTGENGAEIGNLIGRQGAWLADTLLFLFGFPAALFPAMLGAACFMFRTRDAEEASSRANTLVRAGGFVLLLAASCALAALHWPKSKTREWR